MTTAKRSPCKHLFQPLSSLQLLRRRLWRCGPTNDRSRWTSSLVLSHWPPPTCHVAPHHAPCGTPSDGARPVACFAARMLAAGTLHKRVATSARWTIHFSPKLLPLSHACHTQVGGQPATRVDSIKNVHRHECHQHHSRPARGRRTQHSYVLGEWRQPGGNSAGPVHKQCRWLRSLLTTTGQAERIAAAC